MNSVYSAVPGRLEKGSPLALATIVETSGSTPQVPGVSALFSQQGLAQGTLGGGSLEAEAERRARAALDSGRSVLFSFDLRGSGLEDEEPVCGGEATLLIDASPASNLDAFLRMKDSLRWRRRGVMVTRVRQGSSGEAEIRRRWVEDAAPVPESGLPVSAAAITRALAENTPLLLRPSGEDRRSGGFDFIEPLSPLPRLLIVGGGHIGQAVSRLAAPLGFEVTVIDDRAEFASRRRFPEAAEIIVGRPGPALTDIPVGDDTYIVIVTRGHRDDAEALRACIRTAAAYVGMIGSRSKVSLVRETFLRHGWASAEQFDRVRTPIGLPIGSRTVEEIAVSIAAELVQVRSRRLEKSGPGEE